MAALLLASSILIPTPGKAAAATDQPVKVDVDGIANPNPNGAMTRAVVNLTIDHANGTVSHIPIRYPTITSDIDSGCSAMIDDKTTNGSVICYEKFVNVGSMPGINNDIRNLYDGVVIAITSSDDGRVDGTAYNTRSICGSIVCFIAGLKSKPASSQTVNLSSIPTTGAPAADRLIPALGVAAGLAGVGYGLTRRQREHRD